MAHINNKDYTIHISNEWGKYDSHIDLTPWKGCFKKINLKIIFFKNVTSIYTKSEVLVRFGFDCLDVNRVTPVLV